jgi:hypothetical protein
LEESNKFLELLRDVVRKDEGILDLVVQAPHVGSTFCRVIPLKVGDISLEFHIVGGEVAVGLLEPLQFSFCYCHMIWVPESHFQNCDQN